VVAGATVLIEIWIPPRPSRSARPPAPSVTCSSAASSATIVIATPPAGAASPGRSTRVAPALTSASAFEAVRL